MAPNRTPTPRAALLALGALALAAPSAASAGSDAGAAAPAVPPTAMAPPTCGSYAELVGLLGDRFDERPASSGLADDGTVMQVFAAASAGTWTMVSVQPGGMACVLATGRAWQQGTPAVAVGDPA